MAAAYYTQRRNLGILKENNLYLPLSQTASFRAGVFRVQHFQDGPPRPWPRRSRAEFSSPPPPGTQIILPVRGRLHHSTADAERGGSGKRPREPANTGETQEGGGPLALPPAHGARHQGTILRSHVSGRHSLCSHLSSIHNVLWIYLTQ